MPWLTSKDPFPPPDSALDVPNGLLAAGADLSVPRLVSAYAQGIFPWFEEDEPLLWWSPDPRTVLPVAAVHVSRSLRRRLRRRDYRVTMDEAFGEVIRACAAPRADSEGTWISARMIEAYTRLHEAGHAHSVEVWLDGRLAGGLYGVAIGKLFTGESMFSRVSDGSKIALIWLAAQLARWECPLIDCQLQTTHLTSLGARPIPRHEFLRAVRALATTPGPRGRWRFDSDLEREGPPPAA